MTPPPGYVLIRPETLVALQKAVEAALGARAAECLVAGGLAGGARATAALEGPPQARVQRLLEAGRDIGWGDFALERLTPRQLIVTVGDSPFARVYGRAGAPVCHLTRGVLQTLASTVLEAPVAVAETACAAVGAERCRFETVEVGRDEASPPTPPRFARNATTVSKQPLLRGVLHIGIVVDDLEQSLREWQRVFGVSVGDRWQSDIGVKVAFLDVAGTRLELVEYTGPIVQRFGPVLARRDGVHHVCFAVDDLDAALADVRARGLRVVPGFPLEGAHGRIAFLEPEPTTGLVTELCQPREPV
ncbi:MAG TPA: VOC family protein [Patescibacteria group bacterium]|nr:VOC family protein [Patescibacteria group bacterium]